MTILAFDVAKDTLVGVLVDEHAQIQGRYTVQNTEAALNGFLNTVQQAQARLLVVAEATGDYHRPLVTVCLRREIPCKLLNPILTKQFTRATIRGTKSDPSDALVLAKLALQGEGRLVTEQTLAPVKPLVRTAHRLMQLEQTLRAVERRFTLVAPTGQRVRSALKDAVQTLATTVTCCRAEATALVDPTLSQLLQSLPGIGTTLAPILVAEIETAERFPNAAALVAYAGLDPQIRQSGTSLTRNSHLTKRGSPTLRHALFLGASIARQHDPELREYYEKKRREGRRYKEATVAVAIKLPTRIYAVWKRGTPYRKGA